MVVVDAPPDPTALARWRSVSTARAALVVLLPASAADVPAWCRSRIEVSRDLRPAARSARCGVADPTARGEPDERPRPRSAEPRACTLDRAGTRGDLHHACRARRTARVSRPRRAARSRRRGSRAPPGLRRRARHRRCRRSAGVGRPRGRRSARARRGHHRRGQVRAADDDRPGARPDAPAGAAVRPPGRLQGRDRARGRRRPAARARARHRPRRSARAPRAERAARRAAPPRARCSWPSGARDLTELDPLAPTTPSRLLVVVDELRALTEDVPEASAALARLAAQGRALGRAPRAGHPAARRRDRRRPARERQPAHRAAGRRPRRLDRRPRRPRRGARSTPARPVARWCGGVRGPSRPVQVARATTAPAVPPARLATPWGSEPARWTPRRAGRDVDAAPAWVAAAIEAAAGTARDAPAMAAGPAPVVDAAGRRRRPGCGAGASRTCPRSSAAERSAGTPSAGHLLVLGGPRSGRSTTLVTVGLGALAQGWAVHGVGLPDGRRRSSCGGRRHGTLGTLLGGRRRRRDRAAAGAARPAGGAAERAAGRPASTWCWARSASWRAGLGADRLTAVWRGGRRRGRWPWRRPRTSARWRLSTPARSGTGWCCRSPTRCSTPSPVCPPPSRAPARRPAAPSTWVRVVRELVQVARPPEPVGSQRTEPDPSVVRVRRLPQTEPWVAGVRAAVPGACRRTGTRWGRRRGCSGRVVARPAGTRWGRRRARERRRLAWPADRRSAGLGQKHRARGRRTRPRTRGPPRAPPDVGRGVSRARRHRPHDAERGVRAGRRGDAARRRPRRARERAPGRRRHARRAARRDEHGTVRCGRVPRRPPGLWCAAGACSSWTFTTPRRPSSSDRAPGGWPTPDVAPSAGERSWSGAR